MNEIPSSTGPGLFPSCLAALGVARQHAEATAHDGLCNEASAALICLSCLKRKPRDEPGKTSRLVAL